LDDSSTTEEDTENASEQLNQNAKRKVHRESRSLAAGECTIPLEELMVAEGVYYDGYDGEDVDVYHFLVSQIEDAFSESKNHVRRQTTDDCDDFKKILLTAMTIGCSLFLFVFLGTCTLHLSP
jgi:hypothetical protein